MSYFFFAIHSLLSTQALAHSAHSHAEQAQATLDFWTAWTFSPLVLISLVGLSFIYFYGWRGMRKRRSAQLQAATWQAYAFVLAIVILLIALISPVAGFSEVLGSMHMLQHTLILMVAAPLMAMASPRHIAMWSVPAAYWRTEWKFRHWAQTWGLVRLVRPFTIWLLYSLILWIWHLPILYEAALADPWIHDFQHISFFAASFFFWKMIFDPFARFRLYPGVGLAYIFVSTIHSMALGLLMTFAPRVWYFPYLQSAPLYGLSALEDQQIAGLIMWMPAGISYVAAAVYVSFKLVNPNSAKENRAPLAKVIDIRTRFS